MRRPSLPRLVVEIPCPADWRAMEPIAGDSRARLCRACDKPVYDSRSMTRDELYALIQKTEGALPCLRLHQRPDGTIVTKGCLGTLYRASRHLRLKVAGLAVAFWAGLCALRPASLRFMAPDETRPGTPSILSVDRLRPNVVPERGPSWLHDDGYYGVSQGILGTLVEQPGASLAKLFEEKVDTDHAAPLRVLESEERLLPPGWR